jgi:hypothetical protein
LAFSHSQPLFFPLLKEGVPHEVGQSCLALALGQKRLRQPQLGLFRSQRQGQLYLPPVPMVETENYALGPEHFLPQRPLASNP